MKIFVGSAPVYAKQERVLEYSIKRFCPTADVFFMRAGQHGLIASGCTGFTNFRFAVPDFMNHRGFAIYLDVDMIVMADIRELWEYRTAGYWVCLEDGSTEVSVIDCETSFSIQLPRAHDIHRFNKAFLSSRCRMARKIPPCWNVKDRAEDGMKLLHFTDLKCQPWLNTGREHPCKEALTILHGLENEIERETKATRNRQGRECVHPE